MALSSVSRTQIKSLLYWNAFWVIEYAFIRFFYLHKHSIQMLQSYPFYPKRAQWFLLSYFKLNMQCSGSDRFVGGWGIIWGTTILVSQLSVTHSHVLVKALRLNCVILPSITLHISREFSYNHLIIYILRTQKTCNMYKEGVEV